MRSNDIPQDATPRKIRGVVEAISNGVSSHTALGKHVGLTNRHVHYHLQAARVLGFIERHGQGWTVTSIGRELCSTSKEAPEERDVFANAIRASKTIQDVAHNLLDAKPPPAKQIAERLKRLASLSDSTAWARAQTLLRWAAFAKQANQPILFGEPSSPRRQAVLPPNGEPIRRVQVENYGCLREVDIRLHPFVVALGPNATGKTQFMDVFAMISDCLNPDRGLVWALKHRCGNLQELLWYGQGSSFAFAIELTVPEGLAGKDRPVARYEIRIGRDPGEDDGEVVVLGEALYLKGAGAGPHGIQHDATPRGWRKIVSQKGTAWYGSERTSWKTVFNLGRRNLALAHVQQDLDRFPVALWVRDVLRKGVQRLALNSDAMREPCSPLLERGFQPDGSNLAIAVRSLSKDRRRFKEWVAYVRAVLDIDAIKVVERDEDKHLSLRCRYRDGLWLPAKRLSDGTLRFLALTLLPYLDAEGVIYLIEEPENGMHPQAVEAIYQAISSCTRSQVVVATHSPVFLGVVPPSRILCFSKLDGATMVCPGTEHPVLRDWRGKVDLATLFASGVLS